MQSFMNFERSINCFTIVPLPESHDDIIKWKHFLCYWPFVRGIHRSPVNSTHKGQWRRALMFSLICVWTNSWVNNREAGDLRRYRANYDVTIMNILIFIRPFEKRDVLCRGNVRPSVRPSVRVFRTFLQHALRYQFETWYIHSVGGTTCRVWFASQLGHFDLVYSLK